MRNIKVAFLSIIGLLAITVMTFATGDIRAYSAGPLAFLAIDQQNIIQLNNGYGDMTAMERVRLVEERLRKKWAADAIRPDSFQVLQQDNITLVTCNGDPLVVADPKSATGQGLTSQKLAELWRDNLQDVFTKITDKFKVSSTFSGMASWYGQEFRGRHTASGESFDETKYTAAHRTLPFGTKLRVTNPSNGVSIIVRVNDRGPWVGNRVIDLSWAAAKAIGISGTGYVSVDVLTE